jgi:tetratricopeptide (TPR) repeat protein
VALLEYAIKGKFIQTPTQIARCRISAALVLHDGGSSDEADRTSVRELYETNLEIKTTPGPENFYSHLGLAELFCRGGAEDPEDTMDDQRDQRWKSVSDHVDKALRAWWKEKDALGSDLNEERCIKAFLLKATALEQLGDDEEAIKTCHRCIEEDFQYNPLLSDFLSFLVDVHVKREEWAKIIGLIWRQKPNVRAEFLYRNLFELPSKERATLLLKASVKSNRIDYIIRIFERAREYGEGRDDPYVCLMTWMLVIIYNTVARVPKMAEHLMMEGLPDSDPYSDLYHYFVFPELVDVYHEYFMNACSEKAELGSLEKLKTAMKSYEKNIFQESSVLSMAELTLAKMYFKLGDLQQVQAHINRAFDICIIDLKDSISSNDQGALRALAKALAFVGLESEAQLAFSLQFSQFEESEDGGPLPEALDLPLPDPETSSGHDSVDEPEPNGKIIDKIVIHQTVRIPLYRLDLSLTN